MSAVTLLGAGSGYALLHHYDGNITRLDGVFDGLDRAAVPASGPRTVLLVGSDSREGLPPGEDFQGPGEIISGQRADTIILAHLYGDHDVAQLVSIPRDTWVEIPAYTDPATGATEPAHESKINSAFYLGGPSLLIETLQDLTGLSIDNYVQVDFTGFRRMVDVLGGVEVCLPEATREVQSGIDLPAGRSVVQGEQALAFVRQRTGLPRGDIDRISRQQQFIGAMVRKVLSAGTLANPLKVNGFLDAATDSLQVDEHLTVDDLRDLALRLRTFDTGGVIFSTVPVAETSARRQGQSVVLIDEGAAETLFDGLRRDVPPGVGTPEPDGDSGPEIVVAPQDVRVDVYNGAGIRGLGARVADDLQDAGFAVVGPPGNRGTGARQTVVRHAPDKADSALTLAAALPGAVTKVDPSLSTTLVVVAGSEYAGAQPVTVGQPAPALPPPDATPPDATTAAEDPCAV
jgi:LCP family protein required for cell wall assembly